jgi:insertion element IS1 protein InsB
VPRLPPRAYSPSGGPLQARTIRASCGHIHNGTPNDRGKDCGRHCVGCFAHDLISDDTRALIERLPVERISWRGICRALGGTLKWLLGLRVEGFEASPDPPHVQPVTCEHDVMSQRREVEADDRAGVGRKEVNRPWSWPAVEATSRRVLAVHGGDRSRRRAKRLWAQMPAASRPHATCSTAPWVVSAGVMPAAPHRAVSARARQTTHGERCHNTRRQRVSRVGREAVSCATKLAKPSGAVTMCICPDTLTRAAA